MHPERTPDHDRRAGQRRLLVSQLNRVRGELRDRARVLSGIDRVRRPGVWASVKADLDKLKADIAGYRVLIAQLDAETAADDPAVTR